MPWTSEEINILKSLRAENKLLYKEIAQKLGKLPASVCYMANRLGLPKTKDTLIHRYGEANRKHSHLRLPALKYYQSHSFEQTAKHFGLTMSEMKSLMTAAYKKKDWKKWRKETRTHEPWSKKELQFLITHAGLVPRKWIMEKLGRGKNVCHIKERLQALGLASRTMQGISLSQFRVMFEQEPGFYLKTFAGPSGGASGAASTLWRTIPWVYLDQEIKAKRLKTGIELRTLISARAQFQEWIFEGNALKKMKRIINNYS